MCIEEGGVAWVSRLAKVEGHLEGERIKQFGKRNGSSTKPLTIAYFVQGEVPRTVESKSGCWKKEKGG